MTSEQLEILLDEVENAPGMIDSEDVRWRLYWGVRQHNPEHRATPDLDWLLHKAGNTGKRWVLCQAEWKHAFRPNRRRWFYRLNASSTRAVSLEPFSPGDIARVLGFPCALSTLAAGQLYDERWFFIHSYFPVSVSEQAAQVRQLWVALAVTKEDLLLSLDHRRRDLMGITSHEMEGE